MAGETREQIIMTTKEIARATNLSEGALYRHFDRKEDVFFALLSTHLPPFLETFKTYVAGEGSVSKNFVAIVQACINYYESLIPLGAAFFSDAELLAQFRTIVQQHGGGPLRIHDLDAAYIEEEQQIGRISKQVPALNIAIQLLGPCFQFVFFRQCLGESPWGKTNEQFAEEQVQALLSGHRPSE